MKILTWNVNLYTNQKEREHNILQYILKTKVDVLFLQECSYSLIFSLEKNGYTLQGKTLTHGGLCCALTKIHVDSVSITNSVGISLTIDGKILATCHLVPGGIQNRNFRLDQLKEFNNIPNVICGDFNDENIAFLNLHKITTDKTWFLKFFIEGSSISKSYDHIYHSPDICIKNLTVFHYNGLSDHLPIQFQI